MLHGMASESSVRPPRSTFLNVLGTRIPWLTATAESSPSWREALMTIAGQTLFAAPWPYLRTHGRDSPLARRHVCTDAVTTLRWRLGFHTVAVSAYVTSIFSLHATPLMEG